MVASVALGVAACGPQDLAALREHGETSDAATATATTQPQTKSDQQASVRAAYLSAQMTKAMSDVRYAVTPGTDAPLVARSVSRGIEGHFDERGVALSSGHPGLRYEDGAPDAKLETVTRRDGVEWSFNHRGATVSARSGAWQETFRFAGYGCSNDVEQVSTEAPSFSRDAPNRVSYKHRTARGAVTEWYSVGRAGLEQGFTLARQPACADDVIITVGVDGLVPREASGGRVELRDDTGVVEMHYGELHAEDAAGVRLPSRVAVVGNAISLYVDARGARFPVVVDPLAWVQQGPDLVASDGAAQDYFGGSVALSADASTALVGASGKSNSKGAAYVFVRSGTTWGQQGADLSTTVNSEEFGWAVALSADGNTAVVGTLAGIDIFTRNGTSWSQASTVSAAPTSSESRLLRRRIGRRSYDPRRCPGHIFW